ncbi:hydrolase [Legionella waltersii]|uniref:Alpha/beta hydrolase n=1 Tax=Legionella waltersii TaxID=66969 RepID=A0A0W1ADC7_9GAMM|nr:hydrolase [Legionella waltersii]KTD79334.1 alpha/beta hydrolase [Legionella waltersii]SNV13105.1 alpha/beta hydrolase [Legionella waltersii]
MIINSNFKPARWLANNHVQTIYRTLAHRLKPRIDFFEHLELPDGDFVELAWSVDGVSNTAPLVILLHGLGGSKNSAYVASMFRTYNQLGYRVVLMSFRGASGVPNRLPRTYHAGDTGDLAYLLSHLRQLEPTTKIAVVGISLGGNVLLKWLGESGEKSMIDAAVAVSVPFQLQEVVKTMNKGFSRVYQAHLLKSLRAVFVQKLDIINSQLKLSKHDLCSIKTLFALDENIIAPLHGFKSANDYYQQSSSRQYLSAIKTPTLIIHSLDDPFMTPKVLPDVRELSSTVLLELSQYGGHVGFIAAKSGNHTTCWLEQRIPPFFADFFG